MFKRLHPLYEIDGAIGTDTGVDTAPAAEAQTETTEVTETQTGVDTQAAAEPDKQNNFEKAFAKRLADAQTKWEAENSEKYKDADLHKELAEYLSELNGGTDLMTLKERREMERLQERAEKENVPPEVLKRIDELEAIAAEGNQLKQQQQESERINTYFTTLGEFVKDKGVDPQELNKFMIDNELQYNPNAMEKSFTLALNAFKAEEYKAKLETAKEDSIKEYLASKRAPKVEGSTGAAGQQTVDTAKMNWKDLEKHAAARLEASKTPS